MIEFIYKTACPTGLEKGSMSFLPEEGQIAIFPSNLFLNLAGQPNEKKVHFPQSILLFPQFGI